MQTGLTKRKGEERKREKESESRRTWATEEAKNRSLPYERKWKH